MLCYVVLCYVTEETREVLHWIHTFQFKELDAVIEDILKKISKMNHRRLLGLNNIFCGALKEPRYEVFEVQMLTLTLS